MDRERWNEVARLLQLALDRPAAERDLLLQGACGGDRAARTGTPSAARCTRRCRQLSRCFGDRNGRHRDLAERRSPLPSAVVICHKREPSPKSRARVPGGHVRAVMYLPTLRALFSLNMRDSAAAFKRGDRLTLDLALRGRQLHRKIRRPVSSSTFAEWRISQHVNPPKRPRSSRGFSIIRASCSSIPWARWRACSWRERSRSRATS